MNLALLYAAFTVCIFIHLVGMAVAAFLLRLHVEEVRLFYFPLVKLKFRGVEFALGCLPIGGWVKIEPKSYEQVGVVGKTLLLSSGCGLLLWVAAMLLGFGVAGELFARAWWRFPFGALLPLSRGAEFARNALDFAARSNFVTLLGSVAAVFAAMQLIPLPCWNGGDLILNIVQPLLGWKEETRYRLNLIGVLLGLVLGLSWLLAFAVALYRG